MCSSDLDSVWLFTLLDGEREGDIALEQVDPSQANPEGQELFRDTCQFCHGLNGEGGHDGMPLEGLAAFDTAYVADIIRNGRNNMPAFATMFSGRQIRALAEHVRTLNLDLSNRNSR